MLINKLLNEKSMKIIIAVFLSYYFGYMVLKYDVKVVGLFIVAIFVILFFRKIDYAFYFILASRPIIDIKYSMLTPVAGQLSSIGQIAGGGLTVLFVSYLVVYIMYVHRFNILSLGINKFYAFFLFTSFASIFFSTSITAGMKNWLQILQGFILLNITILVLISTGSESYKKKVNMLCWSVIISLLYPLFLFYSNVITGHGREIAGHVRYAMFGRHQNVFSYILLIVFPFCLFQYTAITDKFKKILWLVFIIMITYTIYITYTRNVWIGFAVFLLCWFTLNRNFIVFYIYIVFVGVVLVNPDVQDYLQDIYLVFSSGAFFDLDPNLLSGRMGIWQQNIRYFINQSTILEKIIGNGYDVMFRFSGYVRSGRSAPQHNNYLILLMTTGIFGLSFYLLYIIKLFQESLKLLRSTTNEYLRNLAKIFVSVLVSYLVISMATHVQFKITFQYYFSVFAGFIIAGNILRENRDEKEKKLLIDKYSE